MKRVLLIFVAALSLLAASAQHHIVLTKDNVNLRGEASTTAPVVKKAHRGALLEFVSEKPGWFRSTCKNLCQA